MLLNGFIGDEFKALEKFFVGAGPMLERLTESVDIVNKTAAAKSNYPPYNIKRVSDTRYAIELAVAGFTEDDIDVTIEDKKLHITGSSPGETSNSEDEYPYYIHRGLANRNFTRCFTLADNTEVDAAEITNGILTVWLNVVIPETEKPKKVKIRKT